MEIWILLNPIIKFFLYIAVFGSVGTLVFISHFHKLLKPAQLDDCFKIKNKFTKVGVLVSFISILSIPGNMSGDLMGIIDINMINLSVDTLALKSSLLLFIGFILIYYLPTKFKKIFFLGKHYSCFYNSLCIYCYRSFNKRWSFNPSVNYNTLDRLVLLDRRIITIERNV